ncbi:MAG: hypothetical protein IKP98_01675 [Bacilli bacterium]|nr:hypothetical protein [Bacilli bacterium]
MKSIKKYLLFVFAFVLLLASVIFFVYTIKANSDDNKIGISYAEITGIKTGTESFSNDGLNYSDTANYHVTSGYVVGNDSNADNAIVRSFDKITYNFDLGIKNKEELTNTTGLTAYSNKIINITVTLPEEVAKYVAFEEKGNSGSTSYTYEIKNVNEINGSKTTASVTLYVLGAPNGTIIDPKFEIEESTNTDSDYIVTLGNIGTKHNYRFDALQSNNYSTAANFYNYMPTVVSSIESADLGIVLVSGDSQKGTLDSKDGRYMNFVLGFYSETNKKGKSMPSGPIVLNGSFNQTGSEDLIVKSEFVRLYSDSKTGVINPVKASLPYSGGSSSSSTKKPGSIVASNITNNSFVLTISNYGSTYGYPGSNADGSAANKSYIGTYAITLFSPRSSSDGNSDITVNLSINGSNVDLVSGVTTINGTNASTVNTAYVNQDYNLESDLYELDGTTKITGGPKSKGSEILYVTTFNYSSSNSNQGLKEVIKIDPYAYRFMPYGDNDIEIKLYCGKTECDNVTADDFEVKFIDGDFKNANYTASTLDTRIKEEDRSTIQNGCTTISNNLTNYNTNQIMNLYGGPCIEETSPTVYTKLSDASVNDEEVVLSKMIVQTKDGIKLPSDVKVVIKTKLRIRNVNDITKTYQVNALAMSSDYDNAITYYSPRVINNDNPSDIITNPNNNGDSLKIVNTELKQTVMVTNKNKDGKMKTNFNAVDNETIHFKIATNLSDMALNVGADDTWFIKELTVYVDIPKTLTYLPNEYNVNPVEVIPTANGTTLKFIVPCTKPNEAVSDIYFDAILSSDLSGNANEIVVSSLASVININDEVAASDWSALTLYGSGINNMVISVSNDTPTSIEKDSDFSYTINAYNNTNSDINDYTILNVLPFTGDDKGSSFSGKYSVHLDGDNLGTAKVYCTTDNSQTVNEEVNDTSNEYTECMDLFNEGVYKEVTALKITNINVNAHSGMSPIKVTIRTNGNNYSDKYAIKVVGGSTTYMPIKSNTIKYEVINRKISGKVFIDVDEDGVQNGNDIALANVPVTLYRIVDNAELDLVGEKTTLDNGTYTFENLDKGFYKLRFNYDSDSYDLSLRYAIEDTDKDSDAYKISDGIAEITNKHDPYSHDGIDLITNAEAKNLDLGLINRKPFGMIVKKYITKVDLSYNGITDTKTYNNESKVLLSVRNSLKATLKVYYGFEIINNSQVAGYVENIYEDIPYGLVFDSSDPYNAGWVMVDDRLQNTSFQNRLIRPGEAIFAQIALNMPSREEAGSFLNTVTLDIKEENPTPIAKDASYNSENIYVIGEEVEYANLNWHVINATPNGDNQTLTLLLDADSATNNGGFNNTSVYKFSTLNINTNSQIESAKSIFEDNIVCDDASGLVNGSHGGALKDHEPCTSNQYVTSKVRLLTEEEFNGILAMNLSDVSWLLGNKDYYLQTAVNIPTEYNNYGQVTNDFSNYIRYVDTNASSVGVTSISPVNKAFRYVITVNSKYILN